MLFMYFMVFMLFVFCVSFVLFSIRENDLLLISDLIIDIYVNGELVSSKILNYIPTPIPILSDTGTLYIGKDNGFNGTMTKLTYFNYGVSESDIQKYYLQGY